jgi:hypothetical protein
MSKSADPVTFFLLWRNKGYTWFAGSTEKLRMPADVPEPDQNYLKITIFSRQISVLPAFY